MARKRKRPELAREETRYGPDGLPSEDGLSLGIREWYEPADDSPEAKFQATAALHAALPARTGRTLLEDCEDWAWREIERRTNLVRCSPDSPGWRAILWLRSQPTHEPDVLAAEALYQVTLCRKAAESGDAWKALVHMHDAQAAFHLAFDKIARERDTILGKKARARSRKGAQEIRESRKAEHDDWRARAEASKLPSRRGRARWIANQTGANYHTVLAYLKRENL